MEFRSTDGVVEPPTLVQARRSRVPFFGDRPEQPVLGLDPFPRRAPVVGGAAGGGEAELFEDLARVGVREVVAAAESVGEVDEDLPVASSLAGRLDRGVDLDDPPLARGGGAFVLFVERAGQDDVGVMARFGDEEVDHAVELEPIECLTGEVRIR